MISAEPFLKWAGGKRQLIHEIESIFPNKIKETKQIDCYIEPFVGGGALLFHLLSNYDVRKAIINDINPDLILAYRVIKSNINELIMNLETKEKEYLSLNEGDREKFFYDIRSKFNNNHILEETCITKQIEKVANLMILNKTCFNGLFRQNSKGEFNVPYGRYKNPKILNRRNLLNVSKLLQKVEIYNLSYDKLPYSQNKKSLIYFDPPYRPLSATSSFTKYSKEDFNDKNQIELSLLFAKLNKEGHILILSNSDPRNTDKSDMFFDNLYRDFSIKRVSAQRFINSDSSKRGKINELLISNYSSI